MTGQDKCDLVHVRAAKLVRADRKREIVGIIPSECQWVSRMRKRSSPQKIIRTMPKKTCSPLLVLDLVSWDRQHLRYLDLSNVSGCGFHFPFSQF